MKEEDLIYCKAALVVNTRTKSCNRCEFYQAPKTTRIVVKDSDFQILTRLAERKGTVFFYHALSKAYEKLPDKKPEVIVFRNTATKETIAFVYKNTEKVLRNIGTTHNGNYNAVRVVTPMIKLTLEVL